ncbi:MAG: hypothetical protein MUC58_13130 [Rhizobiaceae bacterium]|jgi:hypothetical protein|nr:hypothetical protein [Rhizobiaceae bacterium]
MAILCRFVAFFYFFASLAVAQAATHNDDYETAFPIPTSTRFVIASLNGASAQVGEPSFGPNAQVWRSVWFTYRPRQTGLLTLVSVGNRFGLQGWAIDVFKGNNFSPANRIASAFAESSYFPSNVSEDLIRVTFPVVAGRELKIRVGATTDQISFDTIELNLFNTGPNGAIHLIPATYVDGSRQQNYFFSGSNTEFFQFPGLHRYLFINSTNAVGVPLISSTIPSAMFGYSSRILQKRVGRKPGVVLAWWSDFNRDLYDGRAGTWQFRIQGAVRVGSAVRQLLREPVTMIRFDRTRAEVNVIMGVGPVASVYGRPAVFRARVTNTSQFRADGCVIVDLRQWGGWYSPAGRLDWYAVKAPIALNKAFSVPANGEINVVGLFRSDFIGDTAGTLTFNVVCQNAPDDRDFFSNVALTVNPF